APSGASAAPPSGSATAALSSQPSAAPAANNVAACVKKLFPEGTFEEPLDLTSLCAETDPFKGVADIKVELVRPRRATSDGMKEWALLGWYEVPAIAIIRARCCASAPPLVLPEVPRWCTPMGDALGQLEAAALAATDPADKDLRKAVDAYTNNIYCV